MDRCRIDLKPIPSPLLGGWLGESGGVAGRRREPPRRGGGDRRSKSKSKPSPFSYPRRRYDKIRLPPLAALKGAYLARSTNEFTVRLVQELALAEADAIAYGASLDPVRAMVSFCAKHHGEEDEEEEREESAQSAGADPDSVEGKQRRAFSCLELRRRIVRISRRIGTLRIKAIQLEKFLLPRSKSRCTRFLDRYARISSDTTRGSGAAPRLPSDGKGEKQRESEKEVGGVLLVQVAELRFSHRYLVSAPLHEDGVRLSQRYFDAISSSFVAASRR